MTYINGLALRPNSYLNYKHEPMKSFIITCFFSIIASLAISQKVNPVSWNFEVSQNKDESYTFTATAKMKGEWAIYSQHTEEGGPIPLKFNYEDGVKLKGETKEESKAIKKMSDLFEIEVIKFKKEAIFTQVFIPEEGQSAIKGSLLFMCCDSKRCLAPTNVEFDVAL